MLLSVDNKDGLDGSLGDFSRLPNITSVNNSVNWMAGNAMEGSKGGRGGMGHISNEITVTTAQQKLTERGQIQLPGVSSLHVGHTASRHLH